MAAACGGAGEHAAGARRGGGREGGEAARLPGSRWWSPPSASPPQPPPRRVVWGWRAREGGGRKREGARGWGELNIYGVRNGSAPSDLGVRYGLGRLIARVGG